MVLQNTRLSVHLCVCDCTVESLCLSLQPDLNLSVFRFRGGNILHSYVHGEVRAALLNDCKSPFVVEAGASQGYFSRCDFETFEIKPVDPSITRVA